jgi:hypothetical protein
LPQRAADTPGLGGVLDPIDDRDRVESGSRLPRRLAVTVP